MFYEIKNYYESFMSRMRVRQVCKKFQGDELQEMRPDNRRKHNDVIEQPNTCFF